MPSQVLISQPCRVNVHLVVNIDPCLSPSDVPCQPYWLSVCLSMENSELYQKQKEKVKDKAKRKRKHDGLDGFEAPRLLKKRQSETQSPSRNGGFSTQPSSLIESSFYEQTSSLYLPLSPISYQHPLSGICAEHLSPLILTYFPPFKGVVLSYHNVRLSADPQTTPGSDSSLPILAKSIDEYAVSFVWVTADFLVFRPRKHNLMQGWVNLQNEGNLGIVFLNFFNVTIERKNLPKNWIWVPGGTANQGPRGDGETRRNMASEKVAQGQSMRNAILDGEEGHFEDEHGGKVEGLVCFRVKDFEASKGSDRENDFISIEGTMRNGECNAMKRLPTNRVRLRNERDYLMSGALLNSNNINIPP